MNWVAVTAVGFGVLVGCAAIKERHVTERTQRNRPAIVHVQEGYDSFGRRWSEETIVEARGAPERAPEEVITELKTDIVTLHKRVPESAALGEEYATDLVLTAREQAGTITVTETIPEGAEYLRSDPTATRDANLLTWKLASMHDFFGLTRVCSGAAFRMRFAWSGRSCASAFSASVAGTIKVEVINLIGSSRRGILW